MCSVTNSGVKRHQAAAAREPADASGAGGSAGIVASLAIIEAVEIAASQPSSHEASRPASIVSTWRRCRGQPAGDVGISSLIDHREGASVSRHRRSPVPARAVAVPTARASRCRLTWYMLLPGARRFKMEDRAC